MWDRNRWYICRSGIVLYLTIRNFLMSFTALLKCAPRWTTFERIIYRLVNLNYEMIEAKYSTVIPDLIGNLYI